MDSFRERERERERGKPFRKFIRKYGFDPNPANIYLFKVNMLEIVEQV